MGRITTRLNRHYRYAVAVCFGCVLLGVLIFPREIRGLQNPQSVEIEVNDSRPLAAAVTALERRFGWRVTFEDPRFAYTADTVDVTAVVGRGVDPSRRLLVPRGGLFVFRVDVSATPNPRQILDSLLEAYALSGYPGRFALAESTGVFHVIPAAVRDVAGAEVSQGSVLATRVSLPLGDRTMWEAVQAVLKQVEAATGETIKMVSGPLNLMDRTTRIAADNEVANTVLARALALDDARLSWQLVYGAGPKEYLFSVTVVRPPQ